MDTDVAQELGPRARLPLSVREIECQFIDLREGAFSAICAMRAPIHQIFTIL